MIFYWYFVINMMTFNFVIRDYTIFKLMFKLPSQLKQAVERVSTGFVGNTKEVLTVKASVLYKWLTYSAIAISILLCLFMLQAGLKGNFRSVDAFQAYIRGFGLFAPFVFVFIQAFQVVVPVLICL